MLNHAMRSWYWARGIAAMECRTGFDEELLLVAALLHDLGTTEAFDNHTLSYEEAGGHAAVALTAGAGWPKSRRQRVMEVIVRHNWPSVDPEMDFEGYLLESATGLDITGARSDVLSANFVDEVLHAYPRLGVAQEFTACVTSQAERKPSTAAHRIVGNGLAEKMRDHPFERRRHVESDL
ncbi:HD domain-containing protein [Nakamurella aerolata]|nr:HD domain-containing protein [Nakamurella aerolata]